MPAPRQLQRNLVSDGRSQGHSADEVRADRLTGQDRLDIESGRCLDRAENILGNPQVGRLDAEERPFGSHVPREQPVIQHLPANSVHAKERFF